MPLQTAKERLVRFYEHYNPAQLHRVDEILEAFHYDADLLFFELTQKYGPEPQDQLENDPMAPDDDVVGAEERPGWQTFTREVPAVDETLATQLREPPALSTAGEDAAAVIGVPDDSIVGSPARVDLDPGDASSPLLARAELRTAVYSGAFSPTRRRLPERIGALFSDGGSARLDDALARQSAAPHMTKKSDQLVATATAVVYRKDPGDISREVARALMESAKTRSSLSALATSTVSNIHRSVASDVYGAKIHELSPKRQHAESESYAGGSGTSTMPPPHSSSAMLERAAHVVVPPVRAMQTTLNVDEMSSYQALARAQLAGEPVLEHPVMHASKPAGGLYLTTQQRKSIADACAERHRQYGAASSWNASMSRRQQHRRLFNSPLVAKLRAQGDAIAQGDNSDEDAGNRDAAAVGALNDAPEAISMICVGCGLICSVVPGREHEASHAHH